MSVTIGQFSTSFLTLPPSFISTCLYLTILRIPLFNIIGWMKVWNRSHVVVHPSCFFLSFYWGWRMLDKAFLHLHQQYPPHNICTFHLIHLWYIFSFERHCLFFRIGWMDLRRAVSACLGLVMFQSFTAVLAMCLLRVWDLSQNCLMFSMWILQIPAKEAKYYYFLTLASMSAYSELKRR